MKNVIFSGIPLDKGEITLAHWFFGDIFFGSITTIGKKLIYLMDI